MAAPWHDGLQRWWFADDRSNQPRMMEWVKRKDHAVSGMSFTTSHLLRGAMPQLKSALFDVSSQRHLDAGDFTPGSNLATKMTITAVAMPQSPAFSWQGVLLSKYGYGGARGPRFHLDYNHGSVAFQLGCTLSSDGTTTTNHYSTSVADGLINLNLNRWSIFTMRYDGAAATPVVDFFINRWRGNSVSGETPPASQHLANSEAWRIGSYKDGNAVFHGRIQDVRLWDRWLTDSEVHQMHRDFRRGYRQSFVLVGKRFAGTSGSATYTASAAVTTGAMTCSASATFAAGTKTASAAVTTGGMTCAASATFAAGTKTATAAVTIAGQTAAASATFAAGTKTATAAVSSAPMTASASATFGTDPRTASAAVSIGPVVCAASATFSPGTKTGSAAVSIGPIVCAGSATFSPGTKTGSAAVTMRAMTCAASATFVTVVSGDGPVATIVAHQFGNDWLPSRQFGNQWLAEKKFG